MRKEDCVDLFKKIPEDMHPQVNLVLRNHFVITVEMIARYEESYLAFRGREGGTSDEGRAFFVPYEEITYIRIEREVRMGEIKKMFGETGYVDAEDRLNSQTVIKHPPADAPKSLVDTQTPAPAPGQSLSGDPASIARRNLLDRIRAARANASGPSGRPGASIKG